MSNRPHPLLAIALIALFAIPSNLFAGPFGVFQRRKTKACCCQATVATLPAPMIVAAPGAREEDATLYSCRAYVYHSYMGGKVEESTLGQNIPASQCLTKRGELLQEARDKIPPGEVEWFNYFDPDCETSFVNGLRSSRAPAWEVTCKVWCCDKVEPISVTLRHDCLSLTKQAAKAFACHIANRDCCGVRCCRIYVKKIRPAACCP